MTTLPTLPTATVDVTMPATGTMTHVASGGDLQAALNSVALGNTITLEAGATFQGPFTLPNKTGSGWITIRSNTADANLPPVGTRLTPAYASVMPKLRGDAFNGPAINTANSAHHYRFIGIEFIVHPSATEYFNIVEFGTSSQVEANVPHHLVVDRCWIHSTTTIDGKRGIQMNADHCALIDSTITNIQDNDETSGVGFWNAHGPIKISNNYIEATGINILIGGAVLPTANLIPCDIEVLRNYCYKPLIWKKDDPSYVGLPDPSAYQVKNHFEIKIGKRFLVDGNRFEQNWSGQGQEGYSVRLQVFNSSDLDLDETKDITFSNNHILSSDNGIDISGQSGGTALPNGPVERVLVRNILMEDLDATKWAIPNNAAGGWAFLIRNGCVDVTIDHVTAIHGPPALNGSRAVEFSGAINTNLDFKNVLAFAGLYAIHTDPSVYGTAALDAQWTDQIWTFTKNVIIDLSTSFTSEGQYPTGNFYPANVGLVGFTNFAGGNYRLLSSSPYYQAGTDGKDIGVDLDALLAAEGVPATLTILVRN